MRILDFHLKWRLQCAMRDAKDSIVYYWREYPEYKTLAAVLLLAAVLAKIFWEEYQRQELMVQLIKAQNAPKWVECQDPTCEWVRGEKQW